MVVSKQLSERSKEAWSAIAAGFDFAKTNLVRGDSTFDPKTTSCAKSHVTNSVSNESATTISISLPDWAIEYEKSLQGQIFNTEEEMMAVAILLSKRNIEENTGGPFGAAIFEYDPSTGQSTLFSIGMNRVVPLGNSTLHGEMVAIQYGQKKIKNFSFSSASCREVGKEYHLYTSCEPCAMCLGGTLWSGVSKLVCGATKADAEAIGFDEGPVFPQSYAALEAAGCKVVRNVLPDEGAAVLRRYGEIGVIYNGKE